MRFLEQLQRLQRIDELIDQERTGTAERLAQRLGVAPIRYSRRVQSYIYTEDFDLYQVGSKALLPVLA